MTVRITALRPAVAPEGPPPVFNISTDRQLFDVEVAADRALFDAALAPRRTARNFFAACGIPARGEPVQVAITKEAWAALRLRRTLYYRALAYGGASDAPAGVEASVAESADAPAFEIAPSPTQPPPLRGPISADLGWLRVQGNRVLDAHGRTVVLRGVNRHGMEWMQRGNLDPTGRPGRTAREAAGITRGEIREIARDWGANVIRIPINQEWALTRPEYVADLDQIVAWAAAEGAYTTLALRRLDATREWGTYDDGAPNPIAPLPDESSLRLWRMLAARYAREPAVLFDLFDAPHEPLTSDTTYAFAPPADADWVGLWHTWVRRLEAVVHRVHERALLFVSGWDWGLNLRSSPIVAPAGRPLANIVYTAHAFYDDTGDGSEAFDDWFGFPALRLAHPLFVIWGGYDGQLGWGERLRAYLQDRARTTDGIWQGVAGWCVSSWSEDPPLVERATKSGAQGMWRTFERDNAGLCIATRFGHLVKAVSSTEER